MAVILRFGGGRRVCSVTPLLVLYLRLNVQVLVNIPQVRGRCRPTLQSYAFSLSEYNVCIPPY